MILILLFCDLLFPSISNYCYFTSYACWNKWRSGKSLASKAVLHGSSPTLGDFLMNFFSFLGSEGSVGSIPGQKGAFYGTHETSIFRKSTKS